MEVILRESKPFMGQDDHNSNGDYGQFFYGVGNFA
jgi:hypothetical protein